VVVVVFNEAFDTYVISELVPVVVIVGVEIVPVGVYVVERVDSYPVNVWLCVAADKECVVSVIDVVVYEKLWEIVPVGL